MAYGGSFGGPRRSGPREMHKATCADCGKECEVPFKPTEGKPVYCRDCFPKHRSERPGFGGERRPPRERPGFGGPRRFGPREMHKATCAKCGAECEVPFKPTEGRPVYCRDCFQKRRY